MSEKRTTARAFHDADGVEDWWVLFSGAHASFRVRSFAEAATFHPPRPGRGRTHIDVSVPADQAEARVAAALEAG